MVLYNCVLMMLALLYNVFGACLRVFVIITLSLFVITIGGDCC